jgi:phage shock protein A
MNQKLVQSLVQIILSLSDEERQYLEHEVKKSSLAKQIEDLEDKLKNFEKKYQMSSQEFNRQFQEGKLGDSIDFFEWNTYYEMLTASQVKLTEKV